MRINKNKVFKKLSVEDIEHRYNITPFKQSNRNSISNELNIVIEVPQIPNETIINEVNINNSTEEEIRRIFLEEAQQKIKSSDNVKFKINGDHVCITIDEEREIMVYDLEQRGTIFFRSESDTHFWEKII